MPRKKGSRRRRHERRTHAPAPEPPAAPPAAAAPRVSWAGFIGSLLGFALMLSIAVGVLVDPGEASRILAAVPLVMAALYLPAMWASLARTDQRRTILRGSAAASIVMAFTGGALLGPVAFVVLLPSTALLWLASGGLRR